MPANVVTNLTVSTAGTDVTVVMVGMTCVMISVVVANALAVVTVVVAVADLVGNFYCSNKGGGAAVCMPLLILW